MPHANCVYPMTLKLLGDNYATGRLDVVDEVEERAHRNAPRSPEPARNLGCAADIVNVYPGDRQPGLDGDVTEQSEEPHPEKVHPGLNPAEGALRKTLLFPVEKAGATEPVNVIRPAQKIACHPQGRRHGWQFMVRQ